jgi:hypothetical protein
MDDDQIVLQGKTKIHDKKNEEIEVKTFPRMGIHTKIWNENFIQFLSILFNFEIFAHWLLQFLFFGKILDSLELKKFWTHNRKAMVKE